MRSCLKVNVIDATALENKDHDWGSITGGAKCALCFSMCFGSSGFCNCGQECNDEDSYPPDITDAKVQFWKNGDDDDKIHTDTYDNSLNPIWDFVAHVPFDKLDTLSFQIFDVDKYTGDDKMWEEKNWKPITDDEDEHDHSFLVKKKQELGSDIPASYLHIKTQFHELCSCSDVLCVPAPTEKGLYWIRLFINFAGDLKDTDPWPKKDDDPYVEIQCGGCGPAFDKVVGNNEDRKHDTNDPVWGWKIEKNFQRYVLNEELTFTIYDSDDGDDDEVVVLSTTPICDGKWRQKTVNSYGDGYLGFSYLCEPLRSQISYCAVRHDTQSDPIVKYMGFSLAGAQKSLDQDDLGTGSYDHRQIIVPIYDGKLGNPDSLPPKWPFPECVGDLKNHFKDHGEGDDGFKPNWEDCHVGSKYNRDAPDRDAMKQKCAEELNTLVWYCVVDILNCAECADTDTGPVTGRVVGRSITLSDAQQRLGVGSPKKPQGIMPMHNKPVLVHNIWSTAGDPNYLEKKWDGGSMYWKDWSDIQIMRKACDGQDLDG